MSTDSGFTEFIVDSSQSSTHEAGASSWRSVQRQLFDVINDSVADQSCLDQLAQCLRQATELFALGWWEADSQGQLTQTPSLVHFLPSAEAALAKLLTTAAQDAAQQRATSRRTDDVGHVLQRAASAATQVARPGRESADAGAYGSTTAFVAIAAPARSAAGLLGVLAGCFKATQLPMDVLVTLIETAASAAAINHSGLKLFAAEREIGAVAAIVDLAARLEAAETIDDACRLLTNEVARHTGLPLVAVALRHGRSHNCRLMAIAGEPSITRDSERTRAFEAACDELLIRDDVTLWPPESVTQRHGLLTLKQLQGVIKCDGLLGAPIRDHAGEVIGAWLLAGDRGLVHDRVTQQFVRACEHRLGGTLKLIRQAEQPRWRRLIRDLSRKLGRSPLKTTAIAGVVLLGALALPLTYRVKCQCELQPVVRRFVAAPFDGGLDQAFVEPGDIVKAGHLLARMDHKEIHWELAGLEAESSRASKESDTALAKLDFAAAQISRYDFERLELRKALLSHRGDHLEIRSPIDGLVIVGDLKKSEGIPLKTGDQLFEIAPVERMLVEVAIPEADITHATAGQTVEISLDAFPGQSWSGSLIRIHPRSELREEEHVFIAEVELDNTNGKLRPGMQGRAKVATSLRPLGWIWLHKPWQQAAMWLGW